VADGLRRVFDFLRSDDIPPLARPNYRLERLHMLGWGIFAGLVEGNTSSIVVAKTFGASPALVTVVYATPMLANLLTFLTSAAVRGRPRRPAFLLLGLLATASFLSVGLTPSEPRWGGWIFAAQVAAARIFLAALITVRAGMWGVNYPVTHRAQITGRLYSLRFLIGLATTTTIALLFDVHAELYRWVYPAIAAVGALSLLPVRRLRMRGERRELRRFREHLAQRDLTHHLPLRRFLANLREAAAILGRDRTFARYCTAQYFLGSGNFMMDAILVIVVTTGLRLDYLHASLLLDLLPNLIMLGALASAARHFDRVGVVRFRVQNSTLWLASILCAAAALAALALRPMPPTALAILLLVASRAINGLARAGGTIAWNLGHLQFAGEHNAELYMGIHVALTGMRGMIMPFVGLVAYQWLGWASALLAVGFAAAALALFWRLAAAQSRASPDPGGGQTSAPNVRHLTAERAPRPDPECA